MKIQFTESEKKLLDVDLVELNLSVRAFLCLTESNIKSIRELITYSSEDLMKKRKFGYKSLAEIEKALLDLGLSLRNEENVKIELIKETKVGNDPWYSICLDDNYIVGTGDIEKAEQLYNEIKNGRIKEKTILKSEDVLLSLRTN